MAPISGEVVVDSSVVMKFLREEEDSVAAVALFARFQRGVVDFAVPEFLLVEVVNIIWVKWRRKELSKREASDAVTRLVRLSADLVVASIGELPDSVFRLSVSLDHPAYDAAYLALAEARGVPFITADRTLFRKIQQHKLRKPRVHLLADLEFAD